MKDSTNRLVTWLLGLTRITRYFVIALLFHLGLLVLLGSFKIVTHVIGERRPPIGRDDPDLQTQVTTETEPTGLAPVGLPTGAAGQLPNRASPAAGNPSSLPTSTELTGIVSPVIGVPIEIGTGNRGIPQPTFPAGQPAGQIALGIPGGEIFQGRDERERDKILTTIAGGDDVKKAVHAALLYLKSTQRADGSWPCATSDLAGTALAMLAFLGHGQTSDSVEFGDNVSRGMNYLVSAVGSNGLVRGQNMYAQAITTLALAEGYAMMPGPFLREPLERAVSLITRAQQLAKTNPLHTGGWRYSPTANDADLSVSGWMIMALKSAQAAGLAVPPAAFASAEQYLWQMHDPTGFGYTTPAATPTMTAVGVLCLQFLGRGEDTRLTPALSLLRKQKLDWEGATGNHVLYGWYYQTQALFQNGGDGWIAWNNQMRDTLVKRQRENGSWMPPDASGEARTFAQTPVYSTALSAMMLEVYYRYRPLYLKK